MADRQSSESSHSAAGALRLSVSDADVEIALRPVQNKSAEEPLLAESERSFEDPIHKQYKSSRKVLLSVLVLLSLLCLLLAGAIGVLVASQRFAHGHSDESRWNVKNFKSFLAFGDSYTDEQRMTYFSRHNNTPPPPGTLLGESFYTTSGGRIWARYVVQYTGSSDNEQWTPQMDLYNYAVGGSFCTKEIVPRVHPTLLEYAVPAFAADQNTSESLEPFFKPALTPSNSVFSVWIGTNDLGMFAFLTNDQVRGKTLTDYTDCVYAALDGLYAAGARTFVLMNTAPLHLAPVYANRTLHGEGGGDNNGRAEKMKELTTSANNIFRYQTPYEFMVSHRYPGAQVALFDVWSLFHDIYFNPESYLNGTAPANVTSYITHSKENQKSPDSFLWHDNLHPSEQTDRIIAKNFVEVLNGTSKYAQYW
ncbi:hypothetical protein LTS15_007797 [Exophiala xenobiotica]|nr:hypothetical protein LTS15_007797 [Exophiala xenobiotica]